MKKILLHVPPPMLEDIDRVAQAEHRNRSDLLREAFRRYLDDFRRKEREASPLRLVPNEPTRTD